MSTAYHQYSGDVTERVVARMKQILRESFESFPLDALTIPGQPTACVVGGSLVLAALQDVHGHRREWSVGDVDVFVTKRHAPIIRERLCRHWAAFSHCVGGSSLRHMGNEARIRQLEMWTPIQALSGASRRMHLDTMRVFGRAALSTAFKAHLRHAVPL